jgi:tetratricopeptide (TPR) repeat protein
MINYLAAARGNQAWVYWREGDLARAESEANAALDLWGQVPFVYPFHWTALWPLLAIAVEKGQFDRAIEYARGLLKPEQQRLPDKITETLEAVIYAVQDDRPEAAHLGLKIALELAKEIGYL